MMSLSLKAGRAVVGDRIDVPKYISVHEDCFGLSTQCCTLFVLLSFWVTVKAATHECVIRTGLP